MLNERIILIWIILVHVREEVQTQNAIWVIYNIFQSMQVYPGKISDGLLQFVF